MRQRLNQSLHIARRVDGRNSLYTDRTTVARPHTLPTQNGKTCPHWFCQIFLVGNVGDNSVSSYSLHASETQQLADGTPICYLCGVAMGQPSTNDRPTCNTPWQHNGYDIDNWLSLYPQIPHMHNILQTEISDCVTELQNRPTYSKIGSWRQAARENTCARARTYVRAILHISWRSVRQMLR